jgi:hypothetical protein
MSKEPIACSLDASQLEDRKESFGTLAAKYLVRTARSEHGASLYFRDSDGTVEAAVRELARAEKACCPFFEFSVTRDAGVVRLEISAPAEAQAFVDAIVAASLGTQDG